MSENPRRGRQARNFTTNVPKILDLKSFSEQIFSRKLSLGAPAVCLPFSSGSILNALFLWTFLVCKLTFPVSFAFQALYWFCLVVSLFLLPVDQVLQTRLSHQLSDLPARLVYYKNKPNDKLYNSGNNYAFSANV